MQAYNLDKPFTNNYIEVGAYSTSSHTLYEKYEITQTRTQTPWKTGWSTEEIELEVLRIPEIVDEGPNTKEKLHNSGVPINLNLKFLFTNGSLYKPPNKQQNKN